MKYIIYIITIISLLITLISCNNNDNNITYNDDNVIVINNIANNKYYEVTEDEREMLAKIVTLESSTCSQECQKDVCSVIFNRLDSGKWKKDMNNDNQITLYDIIYYPNAFSPVLYGKMDDCIPCDSAYESVDYVIENGPTVPTYVRYFRASHDFNWKEYTNYKIIDNVYFGYFINWQEGVW